MRMWQVFKNGVLDENPTFKLVLGMCPTLAVTTAAANGVWMGLAVIFVLTMSNLVVSLIRDFIPDKIRIPCYVVVIASFVTIVDLLLKAYQPEMHAKLGIFIPLIVVNCIILARPSLASKNPVHLPLLRPGHGGWFHRRPDPARMHPGTPWCRHSLWHPGTACCL